MGPTGMVYFRRTPHPVIVTIMDNKEYTRVLLYSYYTTITGRGILLRYTVHMKFFKNRPNTTDTT